MVTWKGITLEANGSYSKYRGVTDKFTEEFFLLNAGIGKKLFKNQRGEISVQVYDILNQNKSFVRNVSENYIQNVTTNVLGRYVSISLVYNLRTLTGKDGKAYSRPEGRDDFRRTVLLRAIIRRARRAAEECPPSNRFDTTFFHNAVLAVK